MFLQAEKTGYIMGSAINIYAACPLVALLKETATYSPETHLRVSSTHPWTHLSSPEGGHKSGVEGVSAR